jgi:hypothetical protein
MRSVEGSAAGTRVPSTENDEPTGMSETPTVMRKSEAATSAVQLLDSSEQNTSVAVGIPGWVSSTPKKLRVVGPAVGEVGLHALKYGSPALSHEKTNPPGASKSNSWMSAPVSLIKSKETNPFTASDWLTVKLNESDVRTSDPPPPPSLKTGSLVLSASATLQEIPKKATKTNKRMIFTTYPRSYLKATVINKESAIPSPISTPQVTHKLMQRIALPQARRVSALEVCNLFLNLTSSLLQLSNTGLKES